MLPAAAREISASASRSNSTFSLSRTLLRCPAMAAGGICFRLNCRQRLSTVTGIFCGSVVRSEEHTSELQSRLHLVCRLLLEKKKNRVAVVLTAFHTANFALCGS